MSRAAYTVTLPTGRKVVLAELTMAEVHKAYRGAAGDGAGAAMQAKQLAVVWALREVDGAAVSVLDLTGPKWDRRFSLGETLALVRAFDQVHKPTAEQLEASRASVVVAESAEGSTTAVKVPSGKLVTMAPLGFAKFQASTSAGDKEPTAQAKMLIASLDGVRRSVTAIDGAPPAWPADWLAAWPFSAADTDVLGAIWAEIHDLAGGDQDFTVVASI